MKKRTISYIPIIDRISKIVDESGLLITGDCKLSAFNIRLHIKGLENCYLTTLPMTGKTAEEMEGWINEGIKRDKRMVSRDESKIEEEKAKFGWKAFVTDVSKERLTFQGVIKHYRNEYRVERIFNRLKGRFEISPMYVKRRDQVIGMTHLLTVAVKIYTLIEFVVRRSLQRDHEKLEGLHPENMRKKTDTPTAERLLRAFSNVTLYIIESDETIERSLSPLTPLQKNILERMGVGASTYEQLEIAESTFPFSEW